MIGDGGAAEGLQKSPLWLAANKKEKTQAECRQDAQAGPTYRALIRQRSGMASLGSQWKAEQSRTHLKNIGAWRKGKPENRERVQGEKPADRCRIVVLLMEQC